MTTNPEAGMRLDLKLEPFERYPALAPWIAKIAASNTALSLGEWMTFVGALNAALVTAEAAAPVAPAGSEGEVETGWLIESDENGPLYQMAGGSTRDAAAALRFSRKRDADAYIAAHGPNHYSSIATPPWKAVEHRWG